MVFVVRTEVARGWTQFRRVRVTLVRSNESGDVCVDFNVRTDICVGEYEISGDAYVRRAGREFASQREEKEEDV